MSNPLNEISNRQNDANLPPRRVPKRAASEINRRSSLDENIAETADNTPKYVEKVRKNCTLDEDDVTLEDGLTTRKSTRTTKRPKKFLDDNNEYEVPEANKENIEEENQEKTKKYKLINTIYDKNQSITTKILQKLGLDENKFNDFRQNVKQIFETNIVKSLLRTYAMDAVFQGATGFKSSTKYLVQCEKFSNEINKNRPEGAKPLKFVNFFDDSLPKYEHLETMELSKSAAKIKSKIEKDAKKLDKGCCSVCKSCSTCKGYEKGDNTHINLKDGRISNNCISKNLKNSKLKGFYTVKCLDKKNCLKSFNYLETPLIFIYKRPTPVDWELRAAEDITSGTIIGQYVGNLISEKDKISFYAYTFGVGNGLKVDAFQKGNLTRFGAHSCRPNCKPLTVYVNGCHERDEYFEIYYLATKDIKSGSSVTINYDSGKKREGGNVAKCCCMEEKCRGDFLLV